MPKDNEILQISDGTTIISLVDPNFGFWLGKWNPAIADYKRGGTWQNSSLARGRRLVQKKFDNTIEKFAVKLVAEDEELGIENLQTILRLFEKASDYWTTDWQDEMVWIEARGACETNSRFAIIHRGRIPDLQDPYAQPWFGGLLDRAVMEDLSIIIERGDWLATQPGTSLCVQTNSQEIFDYQAWAINKAGLTGWARAAIVTTNCAGSIRTLIVGEEQDVLRTTDGTNWLNATTPPTMDVYSMVDGEDGFIYAIGDTGTWRSADCGDTWVERENTINFNSNNNLALGDDGNLYAGDGTSMRQSQDGGNSWGTVLSGGGAETAFQASDGFIYTSGTAGITGAYRSSDGINWALVFSAEPGGVNNIGLFFEPGDGFIYMTAFDGSGNGVLLRASNGKNWSTIATGFDDAMNGFAIGNNGNFYLSDKGAVWKSIDLIVWSQVGTITPTNFGTTFIINFPTNNRLYLGQFEDIWISPASLNFGRGSTCTDEVYITNKQNIANLTHIKIDDGGVFSDIFPITTFPQSLLPAVPAVNDAVYFGINDAVFNDGPFSGLVFDLDTTALALGSTYTITWEYSDGIAGWPSLTVQDNTGINAFELDGVNSVIWKPPADWVQETVDGILAFWIRARLSALAGTLIPPTQQNRDIYTIVLPQVNIAAAQVIGDIPALLQYRLTNRSDTDGRSGSGVDAWDNRIITGLRTVSRGTNFQAYLNASDTQNPIGVTVTAGADASFVDDITAPTGRAISFDPAASATIAAGVTFILSPSIARDFYGKFHAFVRANMLGGVANEVGIRLQVISGSGGITFTTETKFFQSITDWELIDLGRITMPVGGISNPFDLGDQTQLIIQASTTSGIYAPDLRIYDLVLMPVDEWQGDFVDFANVADSIIGRNNDLSKYLDIDSITNPKAAIQSSVRIADSDLITSIYSPITPGEAILQANAQQRLWFLSARTSATGTDFQWISEPWIAHSVQLFKNQRYLSMRGDN